MPKLRDALATKYTLLLDPETRAYQRHLRRNTDIAFSDLLRALVARVAIDKQLEAEIFAECGGGYDDDLPLPTQAPVATTADIDTPEEGPTAEQTVTPEGQADHHATDDSSTEAEAAASATGEESSGFWIDDDVNS